MLLGCSQEKKVIIGRDQRKANTVLEKVLDSIQRQDKNAICDLFSPECSSDKEEFEKTINELFEYYKGEVVSYEDGGGLTAEKVVEGDYYSYTIEASFEVITSEEEYRIAIKYIEEDATNPERVGIQSLYIIRKSDDVNLRSSYYGDWKFTLGINIGIPNKLPKHD